jgi:hypothetical protein
VSSLLAAKCCCGCTCTCPAETTLPSSVTATITFTDCCGNHRVVTRVLSKFSPLSVRACHGCVVCEQYAWHAFDPTQPSGCQVCTNSSFAFSAYDCEDTGEESELGSVSLGAVTCKDYTEGNFDPPTPTDCSEWVVSINFSFGSSLNLGTRREDCHCFQFFGQIPCSAGPNKHTHSLCKSGSQTPLGTYTVCPGGFEHPCYSCEGVLCPYTNELLPCPTVVIS